MLCTPQVTLFGHSRLGNDVFLGEVVIPLREVENSADSQTLDVRRYILGRRNAKEKVRAEVDVHFRTVEASMARFEPGRVARRSAAKSRSRARGA